MGETIRQGPHQGAQKSIKTGVGESKTSVLNVALVVSGTFDMFYFPFVKSLIT
jgi:hypothetical protein